MTWFFELTNKMKQNFFKKITDIWNVEYIMIRISQIESDTEFWVPPDPVSSHMEEQGLEFLQFAFRWFNCLLIREVCFQLLFFFLIKYDSLFPRRSACIFYKLAAHQASRTGTFSQ